MGKGSNTTTSTTAPSPVAGAAYTDLLSRAQGVASTPYQAYSGELTAPVNAQQTAGIANINSNAGFAQPYIQQAAQYANNAAAPITADQIQQYSNPFTNQVIQATQNQFNNQNQQQQSSLKGNEIAQGALGGNRNGVAAANLAGQQQLAQAPVIAGLQSQGYQTGLQTALSQQQAQAQGAYSLGNLGVAGQTAALAGAGAQVGAGTLQQSTQQTADLAKQTQFLQQQGYPFQTAQWLAGITTGVGSQLGGTSTTTPPPPNPWNTAAGLGLAAVGAFAADGGRINGFDSGGGVSGLPYGGVASYVPTPLALAAAGRPASSSTTAGVASADPMKMWQQAAGAGKKLGNFFGGSNGGSDAGYFGGSPESNSGLNPATYGNLAGDAIEGFAPGGAVDDDGSLNPRNWLSFQSEDPATGETTGGAFPPMVQPDPGRVYAADEFSPMDALASDAAPPPHTGPLAGFGAQPPSDMPADAMAFQAPPTGSGDAVPAPQSGFGLGYLSPEAKAGLLAAGFATMASKSPFVGQAIGEGGEQGVKAYTGAQTQKQKATIENKRVDLEAKRLQQAAKQATDALAQRKEAAHETAEYRQGLLDRGNLTPIGNNEDGFPVYLDKRTGKETTGTTRLQAKTPANYVRQADGTMAPVKGGPADPDVVRGLASAKNGSTMTPESADFLAERVLAGDSKALIGLGRSGGNILRVQELVAQKAAERGMDGKAILANVAAQSGLTAEQRTTGVRQANLNLILKVTDAAIPAAIEASQNVARTGWVPVNRIIQKGQVMASNPELKEFGMANLQLAEGWARAMNPTGVMRESDRDKALDFLSTADSPQTYERAVRQLQKQITRERDAVHQESSRLGSTGTKPAEPGSMSDAPKVGDEKQFKQGTGVWDGTKWVPKP